MRRPRADHKANSDVHERMCGLQERRALNSFYRIALGDIDTVRHQTSNQTSSTVSNVRGSNKAFNSLVDAYEDAARRVAQRLHDECDQMLAAVYLELTKIARDCPEDTARKIDGVVELLDQVCEETRRLSHELRPPILDQLGLVPALQFFAEGFRKRWGLELVVPDDPVDVPPATRIAVYRVVQEALSNVVRHANATKVEVRLWVGQGRVHCIVADNGVGFTVPEGGPTADEGLGLVGIYERVTALGGDCSIVSCRRKDTHFTELRVEIPL